MVENEMNELLNIDENLSKTKATMSLLEFGTRITRKIIFILFYSRSLLDIYVYVKSINKESKFIKI